MVVPLRQWESKSPVVPEGGEAGNPCPLASGNINTGVIQSVWEACSSQLCHMPYSHCPLKTVNQETDCMNLGTHVVTSSFKPASLNPKTASCTQFLIVHVWMCIGNPLIYELHLFGRLCASQKVTKIRRNVFPVIHAISQTLFLPLHNCSSGQLYNLGFLSS